MMKTFTSNKRNQIDASFEQIKDLNWEFEILKTNMETFAKNSQIEELMKKLTFYAKIDFVKEIQDDIKDFVNKEEFQILSSEI